MFCQQLGQRRAAYFQHLLYPSTLCDVLAAVTVVTLPWPVRLHTCAARLPAKEDIDSLGRSEHINWGAHLLDADQGVDVLREARQSVLIFLIFEKHRSTNAFENGSTPTLLSCLAARTAVVSGGMWQHSDDLPPPGSLSLLASPLLSLRRPIAPTQHGRRGVCAGRTSFRLSR